LINMSQNLSEEKKRVAIDNFKFEGSSAKLEDPSAKVEDLSAKLEDPSAKVEERLTQLFGVDQDEHLEVEKDETFEEDVENEDEEDTLLSTLEDSSSSDSDFDDHVRMKLVPANYSSLSLTSSMPFKLRIEIPLKKLKGYYPLFTSKRSRDYVKMKKMFNKLF